MAKGSSQPAIPDEIISNKIYLVRDKKVMLDEDLASFTESLPETLIKQ